MSTTTEMFLSLPDPGVTPEQTWAEMINVAFTTIDTHSHVAGEGVPITPAAININDNLSLNSFSLTEVNAVYLNDGSVDLTDRGIYVKDGNLFFFNTDGDAVQITNGANIAGTAGSITGLSSPAGASYSSLTKAFSWTYDSSKHAKFAHADMQLFPYDGSTAYTKAITLKAPTDLESGNSYSLTLPTALPPSGTEYMSIASDGTLNHATLSGTANQVNVSANATAITLSLPQNINTTASPTFSGMALTTLGVSGAVTTGSISASSTVTAADQIRAASGTVSAPGISFSGATSSGFYYTGNNVHIAAAGSEMAHFTSGDISLKQNTTVTGTLSASLGASAASLNLASGGAFKVSLVSGTIAGSSSATHSISGTVYGAFGWNATYGEAINPIFATGRLYFTGGSSSSVRIANNSGSSQSYTAVILYA